MTGHQLDPTGSSLLYSTFLGGSGADAGQAIAVSTKVTPQNIVMPNGIERAQTSLF